MDPWPAMTTSMSPAASSSRRSAARWSSIGSALSFRSEQRNQDVRQHVGGDEDPVLLDQQRRVARGMRLMLDDADLRAIPGNACGVGGQAGDEAEQIQR